MSHLQIESLRHCTQDRFLNKPLTCGMFQKLQEKCLAFILNQMAVQKNVKSLLSERWRACWEFCSQGTESWADAWPCRSSAVPGVHNRRQLKGPNYWYSREAVSSWLKGSHALLFEGGSQTLSRAPCLIQQLELHLSSNLHFGLGYDRTDDKNKK